MKLSPGKVLVTDEVHHELLDGLHVRNWIVDYQPLISLQVTRDIICDYQGLIINSKIIVDRELLKQAKELQWIARLGSGMEIIDIPLATQQGIYLISTPEANCNAVAEHALGMILALLRHIPRANHQVKNKIWQRELNRGEELKNKTIGIIGYGYTGSRFEELLQGFDVKVLVYDKYKQLSSVPGRYKIVYDLDEIKEWADLISLHLPLTPETKGFINKEFILACRKSFYLVNTSRGQIVNTLDLIDALRMGKIKGACLDVFENEKPASFNSQENIMYNELYGMEQVILSPHIAGWTFPSRQNIAQTILKKLDHFKENV